MMAPTCHCEFRLGLATRGRSCKGKEGNSYPKLCRKKSNRRSTIHFSNNFSRKFAFEFNYIERALFFFLLINFINVTIGSVNSENLLETNFNLKNLFNSTSLDIDDENRSGNELSPLKLAQAEPERTYEKNAKNSSSFLLYRLNKPTFIQSNKSNASAKDGQTRGFEYSQEVVPSLKILRTFTDGQKKRLKRKRRYVRFPPGEGGRFSGKYHSRPFHSGPPLVGAYSSGYLPWGSLARPSFYSHVPTMRPRSPRLVFRDPVEPGTLSAPSGFFGAGLQDIDFDDDREERGGKGTQAGTEDKGICLNGRCEFFLSCWMSSGLIDGSCGGFLYACCQRVDKEAPKTNEHRTNDVITLPTNFGPVVNDFRCGVSIGKIGAQRRIVGGDEAGFGSFPWQAYIRIGSSRCGGSLVNRFHVVTAGHCVARASARQVQVTLGDYVINSAIEPLPAYTFGVREIRVHPYFKFTPQADRFDVAVLRLDRPVQYMPHIAPICLPEKNEDFLGQYGWAAGWGALQAGSRLRPKTLQAVDVPVIDNRQCERWHKSNGINVVIYDEMMCAGYRNGGKDSCQGDSGGPLMMEKANRWYLIGIVSAGYSCAQRGQPGIYHRVAHTVDWISYIINS